MIDIELSELDQFTIIREGDVVVLNEGDRVFAPNFETCFLIIDLNTNTVGHLQATQADVVPTESIRKAILNCNPSTLEVYVNEGFANEYAAPNESILQFNQRLYNLQLILPDTNLNVHFVENNMINETGEPVGVNFEIYNINNYLTVLPVNISFSQTVHT